MNLAFEGVCVCDSTGWIMLTVFTCVNVKGRYESHDDNQSFNKTESKA